MKWFLYNVAFFIVYLLLTPHWLLRMLRRGGYGPGFLQRLGFYGVVLEKQLRSRERVWVHAVSVGEVHVAGRLMAAWREREPGVAFVVSVNTSTGRDVVQQYLNERDLVVYFPCDFPWVIKRTIRYLRPRMVVLVEGEYWFNLLRILARSGVPVSVVNARLSMRSFEGYKRIRGFFRDAVSGVSHVMAQSSVDAERLRLLGVPVQALHTVGAAKFDLADPGPALAETGYAILDAAGFSREVPVVVGGSTWPGEELALVEACRAYAGAVQLVLVPRHMERRDEVLGQLHRMAGVDIVQRSCMLSGGARSAVTGEGMPVLLLDSTGELARMYAVADLVFVGKSLPPNTGGQNMIEPACFSAPLITGPHTENFPGVMEQFRQADAIREVADADGLKSAVVELLNSAEMRRVLGRKARTVVESQRGATERTLDLLLSG